MLSLHDAQTNFIDTICNGPDRLEPALFAGPLERVMLGLKAHANTISHARLKALEDTFPLTRELIGEAAFNALSREYIERASTRAKDSNRIGENFPLFLRTFPDNESAAQLAAIEWAWLESYHAADAIALCAADLTQLDEDALLSMPIAAHPSANAVLLSAPLASALEDLQKHQPHSILAIRPESEVRLVALTANQMALLGRASQENCLMGNLLALAFEVTGEPAPLEPILYLIGAGALVRMR